jgi:hypothetical protein
MRTTFPYLLQLAFVFSMVPGAALSEDTVVYSVNAGKCWLSVEANDAWHTLRLRVHPEYPDCHIEKEAMLSALRAAFSGAGSSKLGGTYSSLYIGRLIDYPWVSQYLASTAHRDTAWDARRGKPRSGDINAYVAKLLSRKELTAPIEETFAGAGYRVISATVEKVLVGGFRDVSLYQGKQTPAMVPYDAQVWFRLEKR